MRSNGRCWMFGVLNPIALGVLATGAAAAMFGPTKAAIAADASPLAPAEQEMLAALKVCTEATSKDQISIGPMIVAGYEDDSAGLSPAEKARGYVRFKRQNDQVAIIWGYPSDINKWLCIVDAPLDGLQGYDRVLTVLEGNLKAQRMPQATNNLYLFTSAPHAFVVFPTKTANGQRVRITVYVP